MSALSRHYGRQDKALNLAPVPTLWVLLVPMMLMGTLLILATRLIALARVGFLHAARVDANFSQTMTEKVMLNTPPTDDLSIFTPQVQAWEEEILRWSSEHALPAPLVAVVMQIESCGAMDVHSPAGAIGLFQVMPFHFSSEENPYDPEVNAARGLNYLARSYELSGGAIAQTLAGYNGGHSLIDLDPHAWPDETRRYVSWGTGIWDEILAHKDGSDTLARWLSAGGERLCREAHETHNASRAP